MVLVTSGVDHRHRIHLCVFCVPGAASASVGSHLGRHLAQVLGLYRMEGGADASINPSSERFFWR